MSPYTNAALKSSCSAAIEQSPSAASPASEQRSTAGSLQHFEGDDERPLIILDMEESLATIANETAPEVDEDDKLVQNLLSEFLDPAVDTSAVPEDNDSELTDFERQVLSKYMKEMCEQEFTDKSDAVCHLTAADHQQERDPKQVIEFSPLSATTDTPPNDETIHDLDQLNNNSSDTESSTAASGMDENANQIRIEVSKLETEGLPTLAAAETPSEPSQPTKSNDDSGGGQQPVASPTPKVTSDSECTGTIAITNYNSAANIGAQLANTHNPSSTIINCTAIPSTTSTTVAITNMSSTASSYNQARGNQILQQTQQQQLEQEELLQQQQQQRQERSRAMRRNFSVWVGVTSCVWGILIYLIKSYT